MSNDHDNSLGTVAAIGVAILLLVVVLIVPAGVGVLYFTRSQTQYQRAIMAEQQARVDAELARAQAVAAQNSISQAAPISLSLAIDVASDGTISLQGETTELEKLADKIAAESVTNIIIGVDPQCPPARLGEISQRCLSAGAIEVKLLKTASQ